MLAINTIEHDSRDRAAHHGEDGACHENPRDHQARACIGQGQGKYRNVVEVVADFAHHLTGPYRAVIAIGAQQGAESLHNATLRAVIVSHTPANTMAPAIRT